MTNSEHSEDPDVPVHTSNTDEPDTPNVEDGHNPDGPDTANVEDDEDPGWPWSFILLVVAGGIYLIFRFVELAINLLN
jgi:hypothetical protein